MASGRFAHGALDRRSRLKHAALRALGRAAHYAVVVAFCTGSSQALGELPGPSTCEFRAAGVGQPPIRGGPRDVPFERSNAEGVDQATVAE
jgi:hypothetical protein